MFVFTKYSSTFGVENHPKNGTRPGCPDGVPTRFRQKAIEISNALRLSIGMLLIEVHASGINRHHYYDGEPADVGAHSDFHDNDDELGKEKEEKADRKNDSEEPLFSPPPHRGAPHHKIYFTGDDDEESLFPPPPILLLIPTTTITATTNYITQFPSTSTTTLHGSLGASIFPFTYSDLGKVVLLSL
ncbi:hypothetical protein GYMLUDRAFT_239276 [Collybiopsis luxurians FD-317 M1]|nr:hypothetical protein GYMLUDRAFT_239276 [Collybiopsis luxurians FD-317 M1]